MMTVQLAALTKEEFEQLSLAGITSQELTLIDFLFRTKEGKSMGRRKLASAAKKLHLSFNMAKQLRNNGLEAIRRYNAELHLRLVSKGIRRQ